MADDFQSFNQSLQAPFRAIAERLVQELQQGLPDATSKLWHGGPVWFIEGNPAAGYFQRKHHVVLLFWSGQSFDEPGLKPEGKFKAAEAQYTDVFQIVSDDVQRWLGKARTRQWDYKNIVKRKGVLEKIGTW